MIERIPNISSIETIIDRYDSLHQNIRRDLTDRYNGWINLALLGYGVDWQREGTLESIRGIILQGRLPFPPRNTYEDFVERDGDIFSEVDQIHLEEFGHLVDYANGCARQGMLRREAQLVRNYLMPMLYGKVSDVMDNENFRFNA